MISFQNQRQSQKRNFIPFSTMFNHLLFLLICFYNLCILSFHQDSRTSSHSVTNNNLYFLSEHSYFRFFFFLLFLHSFVCVPIHLPLICLIYSRTPMLKVQKTYTKLTFPNVEFTNALNILF